MKINLLSSPKFYSNTQKTAKNQNRTGFKPQNAHDTINFTKNIAFKGAEKGTLEWATNWSKEKREKELQQEFEQAKKGMSLWKRYFTSAPDNLLAAQAKTLEREAIMVTTLLQNAAKIQTQIDTINSQSTQNAKDLAQIEEDKARLQKWESASKIANAFKIETEGGLDDRIAGYDAEKQIIRAAYVDQVAMEKAGMEAKVPNSILLYGAIGTGKTTFARAVADETDAVLIEMNPDPADFSKLVKKELDNARKRYLETGQRTIILLNEIDIHLEDTKNNRKNISMLKNWLDNCSKIPTDEIQNAYATTFFFTTNHPTVVTDEILLRREKLGQVIALEPAAEDNIKAIVQFYIDKFDKDGLVLRGETIDFDKIIAMMNPDDTKGAFGNDKIKKIVELAFNDYSRDLDEEMPFEEHLINRINKAKRNITPERLQEYKEQLEYLYED